MIGVRMCGGMWRFGITVYSSALPSSLSPCVAPANEIPAFASLWSRHPVRTCASGTKHLRHPLVGRMHLTFETLDIPGPSGQRLIAYTAEPGSLSEAALRLLGSTAAAGGTAATGGSSPTARHHRPQHEERREPERREQDREDQQGAHQQG